MSNHGLKKAGILREGFHYQDLIGIQLLLDFFHTPVKYQWVKIEADDPAQGYLDDVIAIRADGSSEITQVKFTPSPNDNVLGWDWLLKTTKKQKKSLLKKWGESLSKIQANGTVFSAALRTNRIPDTEFYTALSGNRIDIKAVTETRRASIEAVLGGKKAAEEFFSIFDFRHSEPMPEEFETQLKYQVIPAHTNTEGWLTLLRQVRRWATNKQLPEPDGKILHEHLTQIITKKRPSPLPQGFKIPEVYSPPNKTFQDTFLKRVMADNDNPISILWGTPGRGKSTYLSYLIEQLRKENAPVIRHHYFLSMNDVSGDRYSFVDIANSLVDQLYVHYQEAIKDKTKGSEHYDPEHFRDLIEACGRFYSKENKRFIIVIDGLDHVWRNQNNTAQMEHLFNRLLPCPNNVSLVIGTQHLSLDHFPQKLIAYAGDTSNWIEIPAMDEGDIQDWILGQHKANRILLPKRRGSQETTATALGLIGKAFYEISRGHPLHLIYSFEDLVKRGSIFSPDEICMLPVCPDGDIQKYYTELWGRLSSNGKQIIHLIAGSDFHWPLSGLLQCVGPIDEIEHFLEYKRSGLVPFHGSILVFARERKDHESCFASILPKIISWLELDSSEYLHWAWLWILKARQGTTNDLLSGTTRTWVIESLSKGYSSQQIIFILSEAEPLAFQQKDYARTIELRCLKTRLQNGPEYQTDKYREFQEVTTGSTQDAGFLALMADNIPTLDEPTIISLAQSVKEYGTDIRDECYQELKRRIALWIDLRHRPEQEFMALSKAFFEAASLTSKFDTASILRFLYGFRHPETMFRAFSDSLKKEHRILELAKIVTALKSKKQRPLRLIAQTALVHAAATKGIDIGAWYNQIDSVVSPLYSCWLHYHKSANCPYVAPIALPKNTEPKYNNDHDDELEIFFIDLFFYTLAKDLRNEKIDKKITDFVQNEESEQLQEYTNVLIDTALLLSKGQASLSFSTPYFYAAKIVTIQFEGRNHEDIRRYFLFKNALRQIAINLLLLKFPIGHEPVLDSNEIAIAEKSVHWDKDVWIQTLVELKSSILEKSLALKTINTAIKEVSEKITPFNERADQWILLAQFAELYKLPMFSTLVRRAANCLSGYGWRKDLWLIEILNSISDIHSFDKTNSLSWIRELVPIVDKITEFTDGDETDHVRSEIIDSVAIISPEHLPDLYVYHMENEEYRYAQHALEAYSKSIEFELDSEKAVAHTFIEPKDIYVLQTLAESGNEQTVTLAADQMRYIGGIDKTETDRGYSNTETDDKERKDPPPVASFPPSKFSDFIEEVSDYTIGYDRQKVTTKYWFDYWTKKGKEIDVLSSIRGFFDANENPHQAEILLDDAFALSLKVEGKEAAYKWLVMAHIHRYGWQKYMVSKDESLGRLDLAIKYYGDRWSEFIFDTSKQSRYWEQRRGGFVIGIEYLVYFLNRVGQTKLAKDFVDTCVKVVKEEVSDQPIPDCPWFH